MHMIYFYLSLYNLVKHYSRSNPSAVDMFGSVSPSPSSFRSSRQPLTSSLTPKFPFCWRLPNCRCPGWVEPDWESPWCRPAGRKCWGRTPTTPSSSTFSSSFTSSTTRSPPSCSWRIWSSTFWSSPAWPWSSQISAKAKRTFSWL